ncbi:unnamed protein product, partial [Oppiella nova]
MSSNGKNGTQEEYSKDSFDRFGDDLCEEILSYLSLKDGFRYECLSKQWRRSIHQKRHNLVINTWLIDNMDHYIDVELMDSQTFELVLKKLPNITRIEITVKSSATERVFEVLMKSYKHLKTIHVRFWTGNDTQIVNRLLRTYGSQLTSIVMTKDAFNVYKEYFNSNTKLTQLSAHIGQPLQLEFSDIFNDNNSLLVKGIYQSEGYIFTMKQSEGYISAMKQLCELKALRELTLRIDVDFDNTVINSIIDYHCNEFVSQWPQLKSYHLKITYTTAPQLRRLFESVNDFNDLVVTERFFDDIDTHLPRLQSLRLSAYFEMSAGIKESAKIASNDKNDIQEEYSKNSFDRFGDDLHQQVLSYLSFRDCFRFECVSKQWRRSIHQKRHKLVINALLSEMSADHYLDVNRMDRQTFESVLKKLPNITRI